MSTFPHSAGGYAVFEKDFGCAMLDVMALGPSAWRLWVRCSMAGAWLEGAIASIRKQLAGRGGAGRVEAKTEAAGSEVEKGHAPTSSSPWACRAAFERPTVACRGQRSRRQDSLERRDGRATRGRGAGRERGRGADVAQPRVISNSRRRLGGS